MRRMVWLLILCLLLTGCRTPEPLTREGVAMDTVVKITLYDSRDTAVTDTCFSMIRQYEALFSRTDRNSEVSTLNAAGGNAVTLSPAVRELLTLGKTWGERTDGAFDLTIAPVSSLWDFTDEVRPTDEAVSAAIGLVDHTALTVTETGALLPVGMAVDLGGIAKGYVADRLGDYLREAGVKSALIDLGGNILAVGDKDGEPFSVGVRDPFDSTALAAVIPATNMSVVTSGVYERCFTKEGVTYHHILNPATGFPVQNGLASVTVVSASSADGDALSTACFVLGLERGMALIESLEGVEALFITEDGALHPSSGLQYEAR